MKRLTITVLALCLSASVYAADSDDKLPVKAAAKKLADQPSYTWKSTVAVPESARFKPGPTTGRTEKDGFTHVTMSFGDNELEAVMKGDKSAITDQQGTWKTAAELDGEEGAGRFLGRMLRNLKTPSDQVVELLDAVKELKKDGDAFSGVMTEEGAKKQFRFGQPQEPKGSVKIWLKDGLLSRMEVKIEGKVEFNGNEIDAARTTTTEISNVGSTKVDPPGDGKKKVS